MVYGMAISKYGYKPNAERNKATGDKAGSITVDLEKYNLKLDSETVRKFIKEAEKRFGNLIPKPE